MRTPRTTPPPAASFGAADHGRRTADGPPPPPAVVGSAGEARATAATWVAATGALLLLAAAGTFLAVSWDALGLIARIAIVATATAMAILGGHRLRRTLPAVGTVVYHLGALLLPVDALGLALQLEATVAGRWIAVGTVALLALPPLAIAAGSPVLGWVASLGVPAVATGVGLAGPVPPAVIVVAVALAGAAMPAGDGARGRLIGRAAVMLGLLAVHLPLVASAIAALRGAAGVVDQVVAAGWSISGWASPIVIGAAGMIVVATVATRSGSRGIAALAPLTGLASVLAAVSPAGTPRLAVLLLPALAGIVVEVAAVVTRRDPLWARPTRRLAEVTELIGVLFLARVVLVTLDRSNGIAVPDIELAVATAAAAVAWCVVAVRRAAGRDRAAAILPVVLGLLATHGYVVLFLVGVGTIATTSMLVVAAAASLAWSGLVPAVSHGAHPTGHVATFVAALLLLGAGAVSVGHPAAFVVLAAVPVVLGGHLRAAISAQRGGEDLSTGLLTSLAVLLIVGVANGMASLPVAAGGLAELAAVLALLSLASHLGGRPGVGDAIRALAAVGGLRALLLDWPAFAAPVVGARGEIAVIGLRLLPSALVPAGLVAAWLIWEMFRSGRTRIGVIAAPVLVRALGAAAFAAGMTAEATGGALLGLAAVTALLAIAGLPRFRAAAWAVALVALLAGWLLVGDDPTLRATVLVVAGTVILAGGVIRGLPAAGHLGGAVATVGLWQLAAIAEVAALDLWLLPVAAHLWVAGFLARRRGAISSWVADVPPLLLVAVPAVTERITGGPGWHSVLAGGLAVGAIVLGGVERLGGPLVTGTVLLVAVVGIETFAVVAAVPTWMWLAAGGTALLGAAAIIERVGGSPVAAVRRLADVIGERFG